LLVLVLVLVFILEEEGFFVVVGGWRVKVLVFVLIFGGSCSCS
jgi:Na+/H+ antiporter NhaD/arsenite permease-like protein